jgi:hypothetical protein
LLLPVILERTISLSTINARDIPTNNQKQPSRLISDHVERIGPESVGW